MRAGITRTLARRFAVVLSLCAAAAGTSFALPSSNRAASAGGTVRLVTLGIPVGLMGKAFWVYADGRLLGSDRTLRVLRPAARRHFLIVPASGGLEIHTAQSQRLVSFLYPNPCPKTQCGGRAGSWTLGGRFADSRPPFIETVALFVPTDMRTLHVVYGENAGFGTSSFLVGNAPYRLTSNTMPIPDGFGEDILFLPPRSWGENRAAAAAEAAGFASSRDCYIKPQQGGMAGSASSEPRLDISEFTREFLWYNSNSLVQALRRIGGRPQFFRSIVGSRVIELTIGATLVPPDADDAYAANLAATTLAGTREYDEREVAILAGAAANAGTYFVDLPRQIERCQQQYPQYAQVFARMLQLSQRIAAEAAQFQSLSRGAH